MSKRASSIKDLGSRRYIYNTNSPFSLQPQTLSIFNYAVSSSSFSDVIFRRSYSSILAPDVIGRWPYL